MTLRERVERERERERESPLDAITTCRMQHVIKTQFLFLFFNYSISLTQYKNK